MIIRYEVILYLTIRPIRIVATLAKAVAASLIQNALHVIPASVMLMAPVFQTTLIIANFQILVEKQMLCRACGDLIFRTNCVSKHMAESAAVKLYFRW